MHKTIPDFWDCLHRRRRVCLGQISSSTDQKNKEGDTGHASKLRLWQAPRPGYGACPALLRGEAGVALPEWAQPPPVLRGGQYALRRLSEQGHAFGDT